jgi:hypothetical protein
MFSSGNRGERTDNAQADDARGPDTATEDFPSRVDLHELQPNPNESTSCSYIGEDDMNAFTPIGSSKSGRIELISDASRPTLRGVLPGSKSPGIFTLLLDSSASRPGDVNSNRPEKPPLNLVVMSSSKTAVPLLWLTPPPTTQAATERALPPGSKIAVLEWFPESQRAARPVEVPTSFRRTGNLKDGGADGETANRILEPVTTERAVISGSKFSSYVFDFESDLRSQRQRTAPSVQPATQPTTQPVNQSPDHPPR